jgi:hypothetical protein
MVLIETGWEPALFKTPVSAYFLLKKKQENYQKFVDVEGIRVGPRGLTPGSFSCGQSLLQNFIKIIKETKKKKFDMTLK